MIHDYSHGLNHTPKVYDGLRIAPECFDNMSVQSIGLKVLFQTALKWLHDPSQSRRSCSTHIDVPLMLVGNITVNVCINPDGHGGLKLIIPKPLGSV